MAIKKSELYSSLWKSCDELRGGMDASQYKDYILVILFLKYISDKSKADPDFDIEVPEEHSFDYLAEKYKNKKNIGEQINIAIKAIAEENGLEGTIDKTDFDDENKLGKGQEKIDRLSKLIAVFENPALDFSKNRVGDDDLLGDAYEYLMQNFATQSGKSKGQFYTPSEVSRVIAQVVGTETATSQDQTIYDPTCGSGSLLMKAADVAPRGLTLYGQEIDISNVALARMNMILHSHPTAEIIQGNTLSTPLFKNEKGGLQTFDFAVANPPFSAKSWTSGFTPNEDERFKGDMPPEKNGDYAFMLHLIYSLKSKGKGAIILPHGVLFRGNVEARIRQDLIRRGIIKGIIGLPSNLFYGTGIPACIILIDKENAAARRGIFVIDASEGFVKDGNKNRLREQDIRKIVDTYKNRKPITGYARMVGSAEIADNDYNLNIPRYIDKQEQEDIQDIEAHLQGGIPHADIDELQHFWEVFPNLKSSLFKSSNRKGYSDLAVASDATKRTILEHSEFVTFTSNMNKLFADWKAENLPFLQNFQQKDLPKTLRKQLGESVLQQYEAQPLVDKYSMYQHLMSYWNNTLQDDTYIISADGWVATPTSIKVKNKKGDEVDKGWFCDLVPKYLMVNRYFKAEKAEIEALQSEQEKQRQVLADLVEEHSGEEGLLVEVTNDKGNISKTEVSKRIRTLKTFKADEDAKAELKVLQAYLKIVNAESKAKKAVKTAEAALDLAVFKYYEQLDEAAVKTLVIYDKWLTDLQNAFDTELDRISQRLTQRIGTLAERYQNPLPELEEKVKTLSNRVHKHLTKMGFATPVQPPNLNKF